VREFEIPSFGRDLPIHCFEFVTGGMPSDRKIVLGRKIPFFLPDGLFLKEIQRRNRLTDGRIIAKSNSRKNNQSEKPDWTSYAIVATK
jgi:hypothetical protein